MEQFSEWTQPADARMVTRETRRQVRVAIDRLPGSYRTVLILRDIEELSTEETARMLNLNANTVKIRLHRARQALVKLIDARSMPGESLERPTEPAGHAADEEPDEQLSSRDPGFGYVIHGNFGKFREGLGPGIWDSGDPGFFLDPGSTSSG